jgi:cation/acetate symporter
VGTVTTLVLIYLSPTIQVDLMKNETAWFPLKNPALITMPLSFIAGALVSLVRPEKEAEERYGTMEAAIHLG